MTLNYKFTENAFLPKTVTIPLVQEKNVICKPCVNIGDIVTEGQVIATSNTAEIHSSIPGTISDIISIHCPNGKIEKAIVIKTQGSFSFLGKKINDESWENLTPSSIQRKLKDKGIINTFSTVHTVSLKKQINNIIKKENKSLIVRLFDEDNTRISDSLMTKFYFSKVYEGAEILAKAISADGILFVCTKDEHSKEYINDEKHNIIFMNVKSKNYTAGFKKIIISNFDKTIKKNCNFSISKDDLFIDSYTLIDIYNAVHFDQPVVSRSIHFSGNCIPVSTFLNVRLGFTLNDIVQQLGGFKKTPAEIIINGKRCGNAIKNLNVPITKYVKTIEFISKVNIYDDQVYSCVKCGNCRAKCPVGIAPDILYEYVSKNAEISKSFRETASLCINCGICNSVCQARLPLSQVILMIKNTLEQENINLDVSDEK